MYYSFSVLFFANESTKLSVNGIQILLYVYNVSHFVFNIKIIIQNILLNSVSSWFPNGGYQTWIMTQTVSKFTLSEKVELAMD